MSKWEKIAKEAYQAYAQAVDNKAFNGDDLPSWENMDVKIQHAWIAAARRAVTYNDEIAVDRPQSAKDYIQSRTARD